VSSLEELIDGPKIHNEVKVLSKIAPKHRGGGVKGGIGDKAGTISLY
jgi:hypothetical protein